MVEIARAHSLASPASQVERRPRACYGPQARGDRGAPQTRSLRHHRWGCQACGARHCRSTLLAGPVALRLVRTRRADGRGGPVCYAAGLALDRSVLRGLAMGPQEGRLVLDAWHSAGTMSDKMLTIAKCSSSQVAGRSQQVDVPGQTCIQVNQSKSPKLGRLRADGVKRFG